MSSSLTAAHELLVGQVAKLTSSAEWRAMLDAARRFHDYSLRNVLLLMAQGAQGRVAGYHAWQHVPAQDGRTCQVARGATGHLILAPMHRVMRDLDHDTDEERFRRALQGFKVVRVFDETQLVAAPAIPEVRPKVLTGMAPPQLTSGLAAIVAARGFDLVEREIAPAFGRTDFATREVAIRPGLTAAAAAKTLAHEAAHVVLHGPAHEASVPLPRERKEVEAESVAYLVAAQTGLDTATYSFPYIARWANGDLDLIRESAERTVAGAGELTSALEVFATLELKPTATARTADLSAAPGHLADPASIGPAPVRPFGDGIELEWLAL